MENILSVEGLNIIIYKYLNFNDLLTLRRCNKTILNNVSFFSEIIIKILIKRYCNTFTIQSNYETSIHVLHFGLYHYFTEIRFISFFLINKKIYDSFINTIKKKEIDISTQKLFIKVDNYYELMLYYENYFKNLKNISKEDTQEWLKINGKWVEGDIIPHKKDIPLIYRSIDIYNYLELY